MKFPQQKILQQQAPEVQSLFARHQFENSRIQELIPLVEHFEIRLPFIGAFSSGKSSLINALMDTPLLSTEITAETAVAAEIRYATAERFTGHSGENRTLDLTREDVSENRLSMLLPKGWLAVDFPSEFLASIPHLVLVDMPGWSSGVEAHQRVIDDYADRSLAYAVVVSVDEGTLRENIRRALYELAVQKKPVILVVTKAHKRSDSDAAAVAQRLAEDITQLMGHAPFAVALTSAAKRNTEQLKHALKRLETSAQDVFIDSIVGPWRSELQRAAQLLRVLASQDFQDAELISAEIENFEQKMRDFDQRLVRETEALQERVGPMLSAIRVRVENALAGRLDTLADRALAGGNINDDILGTARIAVAQALKDEFEPTMRRYLDRLVDALPSRLDFTLNLDSQKQSTHSGGSEFGWKGLSTSLAPILLKIPHPLAKIAAVILPILGMLFSNKSSQQQEQAQEARRREQAKSQVREALAQSAQQIEAQLQPVMQEQIQKAQETVKSTIGMERADIERTLVAKRQALQQGEAQATDQRATAQTDLDQLEAWTTALATEQRK